MSVERDDTGYEMPPAVARVLGPKIEDKIEREHIRTTLESAGWKIFWDTTLLPTLDIWKRDLLVRADLPDAERKALVMARTVLLEGIQGLYERTGAHIPAWLTIQLEEIGRIR